MPPKRGRASGKAVMPPPENPPETPTPVGKQASKNPFAKSRKAPRNSKNVKTPAAARSESEYEETVDAPSAIVQAPKPAAQKPKQKSAGTARFPPIPIDDDEDEDDGGLMDGLIDTQTGNDIGPKAGKADSVPVTPQNLAAFAAAQTAVGSVSGSAAKDKFGRFAQGKPANAVDGLTARNHLFCMADLRSQRQTYADYLRAGTVAQHGMMTVPVIETFHGDNASVNCLKCNSSRRCCELVSGESVTEPIADLKADFSRSQR